MDLNIQNDDSFIISYVEQCWPAFQITQQLLEHPTSDFVFEFYERFRYDMQLLLNQMVDDKNSDTLLQLKTEGDPVFDLLRFINKYLRKLSFGQADCTLTLSDLYEPTAKRTQIRFKVLLNLLVFYEENQDNIKRIVVKRLTRVEELGKTKMKKEQLHSELAHEAEELALREDVLLKAEKEMAKAELRYAKIQQQKDDSKRWCKKLQHDLKMFADTYQNKHTLLNNVKTNIQHLNEQIIAVDGQQCLLELKDVLDKKLVELNTEASYSVANLENRKPTIERFLDIEKQIQSIQYGKLKTLANDVVECIAQLQSGLPKYKEKIKEAQKLCEAKLMYKESSKQKSELLQSEMLRDRILLGQVKQELKQIKIEETEEKMRQDSINNEKIILQQKISVAKQKCTEITSYMENFNSQCGNMYSDILNAESNSTSDFHNNLNNVTEVISNAVNGTDIDPNNCSKNF